MEIPKNYPTQAYAFEHLKDSEIMPVLRVGDTVDFSKKGIGELRNFAELFAGIIGSKYEIACLQSIYDMLELDGITFESLPADAQLQLEKTIPALIKPKQDASSLHKRLIGGFKTGLYPISATVDYTGLIPLESNDDTEFFGWHFTIDAFTKFPGSLQPSELTFPFIVAGNKKRLRYGPYDFNTKTICELRYQALADGRRAAEAGVFAGKGLAKDGKIKATQKF